MIKTGFINKFGLKFLSLLYKYIDESEDSFLITKEENGRIIGFVSGAEDTGRLFSEFKKNYFLRVLFPVIIAIIKKPTLIKGIFETLSYEKEVPNLPNAELISVAVDEEHLGKGVSSDLMKAFFDEMKKRGIEKVKVTVGADNVRANEYYKRWGFVKVAVFQLHKGIDSNIYVKELK